MIVNDYTPIDEKRSKIGKREGKRNCEIKRERVEKGHAQSDILIII